MKNLRVLMAGIIGVVVVFLGAYLGSPYLANYALVNALRDGDADKIEALVDFSSVKDGLKTQFNSLIMAKLQNDPEMANNPFAGMAYAFVPMIVDGFVDVAVSPKGLASITSGNVPVPNEDTLSGSASAKLPDDQGAKSDDVVRKSAYVGLDRFKTSFADKETPDQKVAFVFERRNLFSWKLIKIELANALFEETALDVQP